MEFEWDKGNTEHLARHDISPAEGEEVLLGDFIYKGASFVDGEERHEALGETKRGRILFIIWIVRDETLRDDVVRVVTGWDAPRSSLQEYLQYKVDLWHPNS